MAAEAFVLSWAPDPPLRQYDQHLRRGCFKGPHSLALPTRSVLNDCVTEVNLIRKQRQAVQRQCCRHGYLENRKLFWDQAHKFGFVFRDEGDPDSCRKYYEHFDKQKLPTHLVTYFDTLFLWRELLDQQIYLESQIRRLCLEELKRVCKGVADGLRSRKEEAVSWFGKLLRCCEGLPSTHGYTRVPT